MDINNDENKKNISKNYLQQMRQNIYNFLLETKFLETKDWANNLHNIRIS